jgi:hypothetical protein
MQKSLVVIFFVFAMANLAVAQTCAMQIAYIDKAVQEIKSNISNYQKIDTVTGRDGYRNVYAKNGELKFMVIDVLDNEIDKHVEWYFSDGHLLYAEQTWIYTPTKYLANHEKFYLDSTHIITWVLTDGKIVDYASQEYEHMDSVLVKYGKGLEVLYAKKSKSASK